MWLRGVVEGIILMSLTTLPFIVSTPEAWVPAIGPSTALVHHAMVIRTDSSAPIILHSSTSNTPWLPGECCRFSCIPMGGIGILTGEGEIAAMENKLNLSIEGMHCAACVRRVTNALAGLEGIQVESVEVGSAKVAYDKVRVSPDQIVAAVDSIGFTAHASS